MNQSSAEANTLFEKKMKKQGKIKDNFHYSISK